MGLKHSVGVAHKATVQLLNYKHKVYTEAYVDNVRFVANNKRDLIHDAAVLVCRCVRAGVTINEIDTTPLKGLDEASCMKEAKRLLTPLCKQRGPWLGEEYDYVKKTLNIADKTRLKVRQCFDAKRPTFRTFAAAAGILQYASRTLDMPLAPYYESLRAIAAVGWLLEQRPDLWDADLPPMCPSVGANLRKWRADVLKAGPRTITKPTAPSLVIIVDASDAGWGALAVDDLGKVRWAKQRWSERDKRTFDTGSSVRAEPEGIYRACCRFVLPQHATVHVATDSSASAGALTRGHSRSYWMNHVCLRLQRTFKESTFIFRHTPGATNPADGISRELSEPTADDLDSALRIADDARTSFRSGNVTG